MSLREERDARGVVHLVLDRPETHNALSGALCDALRDAATRLGRDTDVRAVVLTGAGKSFCAGGDLGWMRAQFKTDRAGRIAEARRLADMLRALYEMPKPLIAKVNGTAMGGGLGLMSVADFALSNGAGKFGFTETRLGLIPATISPYVAARMGPALRQVFMSARVFGAEELAPLGLGRVVSDLDAAVEAELAAYLAARPGAVAAAKRLALRLGPQIDETVIEASIAALADAWETEEAQAGIAAFFEGRR